MKKVILLLSISLSAAFSVGQAGGDIVKLKSGGEVEGTVVPQENGVRVEFSSGSVTIAQGDIERIIKRATPEAFFEEKYPQVKDNEEECLKLANWALSKDLKPQYARALRRVLELDPGQKEAARRLLDYHHRLEYLPVNERAAEALVREMGPGFRIRRTQHYRICYNGSDWYAEMVGDLLEEVYRQFVAFFQDRQFYPSPPTDRLEVVLFATRDEFKKYAASVKPDLVLSAGFYESDKARSYFYDSMNGARYRAFIDQYESVWANLQSQREQVDADTRGSVRYRFIHEDGSEEYINRKQMLAYLKQRERELAGQKEEMQRLFSEQNINNTVHEAVHQLAYACGIHREEFENPKWLVEGLAVYFEAARQGAWSGPGQVHTQRLAAYLEPRQGIKPLSLEELIGSDDEFSMRDKRAEDAYAVSWALFYYLVQREHDSLFNYIRSLSVSNEVGTYSHERRLADFTRSFGEIERVDAACQAYLSSLRSTQ